MKYIDIKKCIQVQMIYHTTVSWSDLESHLKHLFSKQDLYKVELNPDFQRGHVWTEVQQVQYVEFKLKGGFGADHILCNCSGWMQDYIGPYQLVDGLQRLTAVRKFILDEIPAFGYYKSEFEGRIPSYCQFDWSINNLKNRKDVLRWYLELNSGGVIHSVEELQRVKSLIIQEKK